MSISENPMIYYKRYKERDDFSKGFYYGYGCFETIAGINKKAVFLKEHLERLRNNLNYLDIENKEIDYEAIIDNIIEKNIKGSEEFSVKITENDAEVLIELKKINLRENEEGIKICLINNYFQNELGFIKSINYTLNLLAKKEAEKSECYEGIFRNRKGEITEGTMSNIFFIKEEIIFTPCLDMNILNGITRKKIIDISEKIGLKIEEGVYYKEDLLKADSIFITNSLMKKGLLWVKEINMDNVKKIKTKSKIISKIEKEYLKIIKNVV